MGNRDICVHLYAYFSQMVKSGLLFKCLQLKLILIPKGHSLQWHILSPFIFSVTALQPLNHSLSFPALLPICIIITYSGPLTTMYLCHHASSIHVYLPSILSSISLSLTSQINDKENIKRSFKAGRKECIELGSCYNSLRFVASIRQSLWKGDEGILGYALWFYPIKCI